MIVLDVTDPFCIGDKSALRIQKRFFRDEIEIRNLAVRIHMLCIRLYQASH